ncbi:hypothetical protein [Herpetosiphon sp. NSE202]|uniref:hypothetical protein n=1 Tax=Herpetosiphon sp. NSE202 TaxID=3351349 RepID=UPI00362DE758
MKNNHDDFLYQYQETPDLEFTTRLRDNLMAVDRALPSAASVMAQSTPRMRDRRWSGRLRMLMGGVALLCALTLTPLRALATNILHELGLVQITNAPTYADMIAAGQTPTPQPPSVPQVSFTFDTQLTELAPIQAQAGYSVYQVDSLPAGVELQDRDIQHVVDNDYAIATAYKQSGESRMIILIQVREGKMLTNVPVGAAQTESVTINGAPGVWVDGVTFYDQEDGVMPSNKLIWNADGFSFQLVGVPSKALALQLAASVTPAP